MHAGGASELTPPKTSPTAVPVSFHQGVAAYRQVLGTAGGDEMESLFRDDDRGCVAVALYKSPPYRLQFPALNVARLSINLTASSIKGGIDGERSRSFEAQRHSMFLTPAGASTRWQKASPSRHLNIYFSPAMAAEDGELGRLLQTGGPMFNLALPGSGALIDQLALELQAGDAFSVEMADSMARQLLVQMGRRGLNALGPRAMSAPLLRRLDDFIDANLATRILIADLALVVGLPPNQFALAFTRYTGRSAHQYVLSRRVERATGLLRSGQGSLAEVANACGFASQQHMTHVLGERLGMTPAAVRSAAASPRGR